ncbi:hypothetical protein Tco_0991229 [Tanacetum coccineum]|uniref:CCHC-type domain-containing protein n=1 Tax=Tanacetum coccineum TaxID=301880 RepID=A0ABQ5EZV9_9ASTR
MLATNQPCRKPLCGQISQPVDDKYHFELKDQFLKELRDNTFSSSNHEDANEHIEKVLEIVDLFHVPNIRSKNQVMFESSLCSLTEAAKSLAKKQTSGYMDGDLALQMDGWKFQLDKCLEFTRCHKNKSLPMAKQSCTASIIREEKSRSLMRRNWSVGSKKLSVITLLRSTRVPVTLAIQPGIEALILVAHWRDKRDWNGLMSKRLGLGYGFTKKACFVCGSFSHLIRDCDFHEKRMAKQVELNKKKGKGTGQGENRPVWNNVQRLNHQNQFVPTAVLTRTGRIPVNTASHNFNSQAVSTSAARKVNAVRPIVNENRPRNNFHKSHSPIRRPFNRTTTPRTKFSNQKVNTAKVKAVSVVGGKRETTVKPSAGCNWRPKRHYWNKFSKYNGGSNSRKCVNSEDPLGRPKPKMAWVPKRN